MLKKNNLAIILAVSALVGVTGLAALPLSPAEQSACQDENPGMPPVVKEQAGHTANKPVTVDQYGDPLPEGVVARLGTVRFRHGLLTGALAFTPDGKALASLGGAFRSELFLWERATGRALYRIRTGSVGSLAISPDGKHLVTAGDDLHLIEVATGKEQRSLVAPAGRYFDRVAFSPDGRTVAVGEFFGPAPTIVLWDSATGKEIRRLLGHYAQNGPLAFSPDGKTLASGSEDHTVRLWDIATGTEQQRLKWHDVAYVAFSPNGKIVASSGEDGLIVLWDLTTGKSIQSKRPQRFASPLVFSPDGKLLASKERGMICLLDPETGKEIRSWQASTTQVTCLAFSPDGRILASGGAWDHAIRLWNPSTGKEINPATGHTGLVMPIFFAPDGKTLLSCGHDAKLLEWDLATGRERRQLFDGQLHFVPVKRFYDLSADGKVLACVNVFAKGERPDGVIYLWDTVLGKELPSLKGHGKDVGLPTLSPDGKRLALSTKEGTRLWDVSTAKELHFTPGVQYPAFSPDSQVMAVAGEDGASIRLLAAATGKEVRRWQSHHERRPWLPIRLVFSPDGRTIASLDDVVSIQDRDIRLWATATGKELQRISVTGRSPTDAVVFSPSGRILAASAHGRRTLADGEKEVKCKIQLWETLSGQEVRVFDSPQRMSWSLAFSPDGRTLASGGADSTILLWDVTGQAKGGRLSETALTSEQLNDFWSDLAADASKADRAIWSLVRASKQSVPLLKERLRRADPAPAEQLARLIASLDSDQFAIRQKAAKSLDELGEAAEAAVRKALDGNPSLEVRRRLEKFLGKRAKDVLRQLRAIESLEQIGTPGAQQLLQALIQESPNPQIVRGASGAMERLAKRGRLNP